MRLLHFRHSVLPLALTLSLLGGCAPSKTVRKGQKGLPSEKITYEGILPCPRNCKGVKTILTLYLADHLFELKETYVGTPDGDKMEVTRGEWTTQRGHGKDPKATVYELTSVQLDGERYFLRMSEEALRALDRQGNEILTRQNVVLMRKE